MEDLGGKTSAMMIRLGGDRDLVLIKQFVLIGQS